MLGFSLMVDLHREGLLPCCYDRECVTETPASGMAPKLQLSPYYLPLALYVTGIFPKQLSRQGSKARSRCDFCTVKSPLVPYSLLGIPGKYSGFRPVTNLSTISFVCPLYSLESTAKIPAAGLVPNFRLSLACAIFMVGNPWLPKAWCLVQAWQSNFYNLKPANKKLNFSLLMILKRFNSWPFKGCSLILQFYFV